MGAALLASGMDEHLAMKVPSWMFSVLCLYATAALTRQIAPHLRWASPAAIILFASSIEFWPYAMSGMLEAGSTAFICLALLNAYRGLDQPLAWWWSAVFIGLGALQKSPAALFAVIVFTLGAALAGRLNGATLPGLRSRHLTGAVFLALLLTLAWPALQLKRHGYEAIQISIQQEMINRFMVGDETGQRTMGRVLSIIFRDEPFLRLGAIAGLIFLPRILKEPRIFGFTTLIAGYVLMVFIAGGSIYPRYTVNFLPVFCAVLAVWIFQAHWLLWRKWIVTGLLSILMMGPLTLASEEDTSAPAVLAMVGAELKPEELLLVCAWSKPILSPGAVSYYASNGRPFLYLHRPNDIEGHLSELVRKPVRGLCSQTELSAIRAKLSNVVPLKILGEGYIEFIANQ